MHDDHRLSRGLAFNASRVDHVYLVSFFFSCFFSFFTFFSSFGHSISLYRSTTCAMTYIVSRFISVSECLYCTSHASPSSSIRFPLSLPCLAFSKWPNAMPFTPLSCMLHAILVRYAACAYAQPNSSCKAAFRVRHGSPIEQRHIQPPTQWSPFLAFLFFFFPYHHISPLACWSTYWLFTYINFVRLVVLAMGRPAWPFD